MKIHKYIAIGTLAMVFAVACNKGIDPITAIAPGPDTAAPKVTINYPIEGTKIRVDEAVTSIDIKFVASDDIELKSISVKLDGTEINNFSSFKDYRRYNGEFVYNNITNGDHVLSITATDLSDKSTTKTVNFKKVAPYVPLNGEVMYLPFDGDYFELVGKKEVTVVGSPSFVDGKLGQAYAGATGAYMTYPAPAALIGAQEFSIAFWYKLNAVKGTPEAGAGIFALCVNHVDGTPPNDTNLKTGIRMFHEIPGGAKNMNLGFNVGCGANNWPWINPFQVMKPVATGGWGLTSASSDWIHIVITVSTTLATTYINGLPAKNATAVLTAPVSWTGCSLISIASGMPNFTYWNHYSDLSLYDEMHVFNRAITADEVTALYKLKK